MLRAKFLSQSVRIIWSALIFASCATTPTPPVALVPESPAALDTNPADLGLINRLSWGATTAEAQDIAQGGAAGYLQRQLHASGNDGLPDAARRQIEALPIEHETLEQIAAVLARQHKALSALHDPAAKAKANMAYQKYLSDLAHQAALRSLLRDLYGHDQLREQLTWFWFNHFNVSMNKADIRAYVGDYEETAIRPFALGRFRDLLSATLHHPAMLIYLDNAQNSSGHINENYAREIMELHTMGVGSGYSQTDVQELARILTGVGVNQNGTTPKIKPALQDQYVKNGLFEFNPNRHDYGHKIFMGHKIKGAGLAEVDQAIDILSRSPATAHFISLQLALYFCSNAPSSDLVDRMAARFLASDGDIAAVLVTLFDTPEFKASLTHKFKDPVHFAVSAVRATYGQTVLIDPAPLLGWLNRMGEPLYGHETPDGYPLTEAAWSGPGELEARFEIARQIGSGRTGLFKIADPTAHEAPLKPAIASTRYYAAMSVGLSPATRQALGAAKSPLDFNLLFLSSPEFMRR